MRANPGDDTVSVDPLLDYEDPYELMFSLAEAGDLDGIESLLDMEPNLYLDQQRDRGACVHARAWAVPASGHVHVHVVYVLCFDRD